MIETIDTCLQVIIAVAIINVVYCSIAIYKVFKD